VFLRRKRLIADGGEEEGKKNKTKKASQSVSQPSQPASHTHMWDMISGRRASEQLASSGPDSRLQTTTTKTPVVVQQKMIIIN
jgi:hypothetical protein